MKESEVLEELSTTELPELYVHIIQQDLKKRLEEDTDYDPNKFQHANKFFQG